MSFYDRDRNITGVAVLTGFSFNPEYGSTASFETRTNYFPFSDKTANNISAGLNTVVGRYGLKFQLRESDAQQLVNFYESQSGSGIFAISDNSNIYKTISGSIDELNFSSPNNGKYSFDMLFDVERNASALNWSGQSFVNHSFQKWESGAFFSQDDIVYFEHDLEEPTNNFFYCSANHLAAPSNHPLSTGQKWTSNLFLQPNEQFSVQNKPLVAKNQFKGSFSERIKEQKNTHSLDAFEFSYKNISDKKTKALLHFLEGRLGYKRFEYQSPEIYNRPKTFFAPSWNHQWNYKDSNDLKISAAEDPFGMIVSGKPNLYLTQDSGNASLVFSLSGNGNLFLDTGNGKQLLSSVSNTINWANTGIKNAAKIYGRIFGFTGASQSLLTAKISSAAMTHLNLSGNSLSSLDLNEANNLRELRAQNNRIGGFDLARKSSLTYANIQNNGSSYLEIGESSNLTGLYASGNNIPTVYLDGALQDLTANGKYSGHVNFSGSSGISSSSLDYTSTLTGRFWNIGYEYFPLPTTTTTTPTSPAPVTGYPLSVNFALNLETACSLGGTQVILLFDALSFSSSNFVNFADEPLLQNETSFMLSDGSIYKEATKICCDIASLSSSSSCPATTTPPPTTTIIPTTTTVPPTTTTPPPETTPPPI